MLCLPIARLCHPLSCRLCQCQLCSDDQQHNQHSHACQSNSRQAPSPVGPSHTVCDIPSSRLVMTYPWVITMSAGSCGISKWTTHCGTSHTMWHTAPFAANTNFFSPKVCFQCHSIMVWSICLDKCMHHWCRWMIHLLQLCWGCVTGGTALLY